MLLQPKKMKYRKAQKGRIHGNAKGGTEVSFGDYGLKTLDAERLTARQIEAARKAIAKAMASQAKGGKVWVRIFPDIPVSKKPAEVRMGKGKGSVEFWAAKVKPGRVMYEIAGVSEEVAREAFRLGSDKLPVQTRFVQRHAQ